MWATCICISLINSNWHLKMVDHWKYLSSALIVNIKTIKRKIWRKNVIMSLWIVRITFCLQIKIDQWRLVLDYLFFCLSFVERKVTPKISGSCTSMISWFADYIIHPSGPTHYNLVLEQWIAKHSLSQNDLLGTWNFISSLIKS